MRSLMLALGACLFALNFAGCSSTGSCGGSCGLLGGGRCGLLGGGNVAGNLGCSGHGESSCGCGDSGRATAFANKNYGGLTGLGLGLREEGPSCTALGCNGGCQSCLRQRTQHPKLQRPHLASRLAGRLRGGGGGCSGGACGGGSDCGCGASESISSYDHGYDTPAPILPGSDCGCSGSSAGFSLSDSYEGDYEQAGGIQLASHVDRRGLLGHLGLGSRKHKLQGCGARGCGGRGGLCSSCLSRLHGIGGGLGLGAGPGTIPHRDPSIHGGGGAGPAGQIPTYAYPYYTTRAPRDFLDPNPPTIGF